MNPAPETEGWILVQPETVARTLERLDEELDELHEEADAVANRDNGEWTVLQHIDALCLASSRLIQAVETDDAAMAQFIISMFEEVEA